MTRNIYEVKDVFTPAIQAIKTFVERDAYTTNLLVDSLNTLGQQIILYGHSGSGKSTLLINKLNQVSPQKLITTRCVSSMTYESVLMDAFDKLDKYFIEERISNKKHSFNTSISLFNNIKVASGQIGYSIDNSSTLSEKRIIPPQLTPQNLARFFGELNIYWILEDFHKILGTEKVKLTQAMKVFVDMAPEYPDVKIIALGAVNSAREVVDYDQEMNNRVAEIYVGLMNDEEIKELIFKGEKLLNIYFNSEVVKRLVKFSNGIPSITHQLCLNICFQKGINCTQEKSVVITEKDFRESLVRYIDQKSDTLKRDFDRAVNNIDNILINPKDIINCALNYCKEEFTLSELGSKLGYTNDYEIEALRSLCNELTTPTRSEIFYFDSDSGKYFFSNYFLRSYSIIRLSMESDISNSKNKEIKANILKILDDSLTNDELDGFGEEAEEW